MMACNTVTFNGTYNAACAFHVWPSSGMYGSAYPDKAYVGYGGTLLAYGWGSQYNLATYCRDVAKQLDGGATVADAIQAVKNTKQYGFVQDPRIVGDDQTRMVHVYLTADVWSDPNQTGWISSWYYVPGWTPQ